MHKLRNVFGHLPERLHASVGKALRGRLGSRFGGPRAAGTGAAGRGHWSATIPARRHPSGRASWRRLTVQRLGLTGALARTLHTTNIIENLMGSVEGYTRRLKRWRGGQMIQRWVRSALVEAEPRFRRVRGYRDMRYLLGALDALAPRC